MFVPPCPDLDKCSVESLYGHTYLFCESKKTWYESEADCVSVGGNLVSVSDAGEDAWLLVTSDDYSKRKKWWIGYTDEQQEGDWEWSSGELPNYENWKSGEPNNAGSGCGEDCGILYKTGWDDRQCDQDYYYICELDFLCEPPDDEPCDDDD